MWPYKFRLTTASIEKKYCQIDISSDDNWGYQFFSVFQKSYCQSYIGHGKISV